MSHVSHLGLFMITEIFLFILHVFMVAFQSFESGLYHILIICESKPIILIIFSHFYSFCFSSWLLSMIWGLFRPLCSIPPCLLSSLPDHFLLFVLFCHILDILALALVILVFIWSLRSLFIHFDFLFLAVFYHFVFVLYNFLTFWLFCICHFLHFCFFWFPLQ